MYATLVFLLITQTSSISIPYINDVFLQSLPDLDLGFTVRLNSSCEECLCEEFNSTNNNSDRALNCFPNGTCQFFQSFPSSYKIKSFSGSRLYFLQNQFPNASQCCMPNITELLIRLKNATTIVMNLTFSPGAFGYDEANPYEAAVAGYGAPILYWFNPVTMAYLRNFTLSGNSYFLTLYNNQTFTVLGSSLIDIRDSQTNNRLANITYPTLSSVRKIIFLNNGQTAVVSTQNNFSLTLFDVNSPTNYTLQQIVPFLLVGVHGIAKVNDTFLYTSSWGSRSIVSYQLENSTWESNLFVNYTQPGDGSFLAADDCGRVWFINTKFGLLIYDSSGIQIGYWNVSANSSDAIYDLLLLPNYIFLISHNSEKKVIRYDPQLTCT